MKNPLWKRLPRELKSDFGKYIVIFLFLTLTIGFVSGFLVADDSMLAVLTAPWLHPSDPGPVPQR